MEDANSKVLKVVIDTNVFVAGFLNPTGTSYPAQIISMWRAGTFTLVVSPQILQELIAKLYEKGIDERILEDFVATIAKIALRIPGAYESSRLDKIDADDNKFLAAAVESKADYIVSLDKKSLLPMKHFHRTQIRTPELFVRAVVGGYTEEDEKEAEREAEEAQFHQDVEAELKALEEETMMRRKAATEKEP